MNIYVSTSAHKRARKMSDICTDLQILDFNSKKVNK